MQAIRLHPTIPRYLTGRLGRLNRRIYWSGLAAVRFEDVPEPALPGDEWVRVVTSLAGICGTDWDLVRVKPLWYLEPFASFPCTLGHEIVGIVSETGPAVRGWEPGERVVVEPLLWCRPRGFDSACPACSRGEINRCERTTEGTVSAGQIIGACRDTGGGWSSTLVVHQSQLYRVPEAVEDRVAVLIEPFAIGLHAALGNLPGDGERALIMGAGPIGLLTLAAIRALGSRAEILVAARHPFQADAAKRLGASEVFSDRELFASIGTRTGGRVFRPSLGRPVMVGGVDRSFECVGTPRATDDALRLTRAGGTVTLVSGPAAARGVDWTAIQAQELRVVGSMYYDHAVRLGDRTMTTFELSLELVGSLDLGWMVTHRLRLDEYARAFEMLAERERHAVLKAAFEL